MPSFASSDNIAPKAKISASTELGMSYAAGNVADRIVGVDGLGEWACEGQTADWGYIRLPWVQLEWDSAQLIDKIVLFDRASLVHNISSAKIVFSDGTTESIHQIPADGVGIAVRFAARRTKWIRIIATDGIGRDLGFSEIEVYLSSLQFTDYVAQVDPYIETTRGRYEYFITGSMPFGMITAAPLTRNKHQFGGGYNYNDKEILGFQQIHTWMMSGIEIMPATTAQYPADGRQAWKSAFSHDDEIVQPGYHRVLLQQNKIWVEQTATDRVSFYKFRYTRSSNARIIMDMGSSVINCSTMEDAEVRKVNDREIEGVFHSRKRFWGGPSDIPVFFVIQFDKPFKSLDAWSTSKTVQKENVNDIKGDSIVLGAEYNLNAGEIVQMKIAISYTSIENARNNLNEECTTWNFDEVRNHSKTVWNNWLGRIAVKGGSQQQRTKFYTDLWHVLLGRQKINDVSGDYPDRTEIIKRFGRRDAHYDAGFKIKTVPKLSDGKLKFNMYLSDAFWLTQWNINLLWSMAWPELMDDFSASLIEYANNGNLLPRGPFAGGYSFIMTGNPAANFISSTHMKGLIKKTNPLHAFNMVKQNQMPGGMLDGGNKPNVAFYIEKGWWPGNAGITIEASFQDFGTAQMAAKLGRTEDYQYFKKRSHNWESCFDTVSKLILPKNKDGKFLHNDPLSGVGWVESNAWQATWGVSHDITKLVKLMGGKDSFCNRLNYAFEQAKPFDFVASYGNGYVSYANQPGCSNAHVFSYAGKPWLTQYWVRQVQRQTYGGTTPDLGYGGHDEDEGQMGAVSALMSIGLFDIMGGEAQQPVYEITSPIFDEVVITLNKNYYKGEKFVIRCFNNSTANCYIQSATLNGKKLNAFWFPHESFASGGYLNLWMGPKPNKHWGTGQLPPACNQP
ncbi:GH92 family glycosyl hydrolase [Flavisolibacter tropicus]|uniref:GH92 family glycosyl hydrolase n=1 Tax=Flavisolibacter tropicus TaxID=1492898 RepID=UPI001D048959|nr:GH92 family glycosyl hydrolase [Flavisolibacter tropicus]